MGNDSMGLGSGGWGWVGTVFALHSIVHNDMVMMMKMMMMTTTKMIVAG